MSNKNSISYRRVGDYFIPNLILPPGEVKITLGKWGERVPEGTQNGRTDRAGRRNMMHKDYLLKHKKVLFETLLTQGKLYQHCAEVEKQANEMFELLIVFQPTFRQLLLSNGLHGKTREFHRHVSIAVSLSQ